MTAIPKNGSAEETKMREDAIFRATMLAMQDGDAELRAQWKRGRETPSLCYQNYRTHTVRPPKSPFAVANTPAALDAASSTDQSSSSDSSGLSASAIITVSTSSDSASSPSTNASRI